MKKYILILFAAASLLWSCAELENDSRVDNATAPSGLSNVATSSRIGSVVFTWDNPTSGDYYYTLVEYERGGQTVTHKISRYAVSPTLGEGHTRYIYEGFDDTNTYTFKLTPYSVDGQAGPSTTVTGFAEDASYAYKYVAETVTVEPEVEGAKVSWVNEYHRDVTVKVTFKDVTGTTRTITKSGSSDGSVSIGAFTEPTEVTVVSSNGTDDSDPFKVSVTPAVVEQYLGAPRYLREAPEKEPRVGVVNGLAYTTVGGETLAVECAVMPGSGQVQLTGQLGDVMKESARAALSWVRAHSEEFQLDKDFHKDLDIHIHVPEGAVPKDGPSAGVTMATALVSALTGRKVRQDVAMTGEITLRGRVLPIGGVKEKLLAAYRAGIRTVLLPRENEKDLEDIPEHVLKTFTILFADTVTDVLKVALLPREDTKA